MNMSVPGMSRSTGVLEAALARWEHFGRPGLPDGGFHVSRLPGQSCRGLYRNGSNRPVYRPDGHILSWSPAPGGRHVAIQTAPRADEDGTLVVVDTILGVTAAFDDVHCRYDPMCWDGPTLVTLAARGRLSTTVDVTTGTIRERALPDGRWRHFTGGPNGLSTRSRPGGRTQIVRTDGRVVIAEAEAVRRVAPFAELVIVQDGSGLQAIDPSSGDRRWEWHDPDVNDLAFAASESHVLVAGTRRGRSVLIELHHGKPLREVHPADERGPLRVGGVSFDAGFQVLIESPTRPPEVVGFDELPCESPDPDPADGAVTRWMSITADDDVELSVAVTAPVGVTGPRPTILTVYGGFGVSALPDFEPTVPTWLESGGTHAVAQVRGGGEHGRGWRLAGYGRHKRRAVDDLACIARGLVAKGVTRPELLVIAGASHGGVLAAACGLGAPGICAGVVSTAAPLDLMALDAHPLGSFWRAEFGADGEDDDSLRSLSPLHRARSLTSPDGVPKFLGIVLGDDSRVAECDTVRTVEAIRAVGAEARVWICADAGHGHNHLDVAHRLGLAVLDFATYAIGGRRPNDDPAE